MHTYAHIYTHTHIQKKVDDVFVALLPENHGRNTHWYNYTIIPDHYPGTHWYHAHWHGSVSMQVIEGLVGALLVERENNEGISPVWVNMKQKVMVFHGMILFNDTKCSQTCNNVGVDDFINAGNFSAPNACAEIFAKAGLFEVESFVFMRLYFVCLCDCAKNMNFLFFVCVNFVEVLSHFNF